MTVETRTSNNPAVQERPFDIDTTVFDRIGLGAILLTTDGRVTYCSQAATEWLLPGENVEEVFSDVRFLGAFEGWSHELKQVATQGASRRFECARITTGEASPLLLSVRCAPLKAKTTEQVDAIVLLVEKGAYQAELEHRLEVSRRLASLGKLASTVAHELNNPLDGILRYVNLAIRISDDSGKSKLQDYLTESRTGLMRMVRIVGDLLKFTRNADAEFEQANVNEVVDQALRNFSASAEANKVVIASDFQRRDLPIVRGSRLYQVCCNLIKNAIESMPDGGRLSVTTGIVDDCVTIRVADTGCGLSASTPDVFEPFFTTKESGKGTGLGLAICKEFIEDMGGKITAQNGEDGGAVFTVSIPIGDDEAGSNLPWSKVTNPPCHKPSP